MTALDDWLAYIQTVHFRSIDMTLERIQVVLERLLAGPSPKTIAVAGTNGKGSCAAMLGAVLAEHGYKTGVYTSPHLVRFNERILIDGEPAGDEELCGAFERIESRRADTPLTYFEFATLAAAYIYQQRGVEMAVMEVGMGGRLDAVNALSIDASLITNVELDHMHWLGTDREAIGHEKAHIMREGRVSVFNHDDPPRSVLDHADRIGTQLLMAGRDYRHETTARGWLWLGPGDEQWTMEPPSIPGAVQIENAAGSLALLSGFPEVCIDRDTAVRGLRRARIRGRCEIVAREPMVIIDVAHNLSAIQTLKRHLMANPVSGTTTAVFGMLKDKAAAGIVRAMDEHIDAWRLATIVDERGQDAGELAASIAGMVRGPVYCHGGAAEAYERARQDAGREDRIVAFGSFHIAGDILEHMKRRS